MRRTGRTLAACLLAAALLPAALAGLEGGAIRGRVLLAPGREAASEVLITVSPVRPETISGPDGAFVIPSLPAGRYTLRFQRTGLVSREIIVDVGPGETADLDVLLEPTRLTLHEEITVTAERGLEASFDSPAAVNTLAARDLAGQWPRTAPEMLPEAPGVWLQKTNHGGGSPFVRGLTGNQILTLVDGIRLNNSTYRYGPNQYINTIDPYSLDRIEVLRGGGSTLYGSDAIGGTLHFLSASPGLAASGTEFHAAGRGKLAGGGMESSGRLDLRLRTRQWGLIGGVSLRSFGDLRAGGGLGVQSPSGYDETAANLKGLFKLGDELLLTAAFQSVRQPEVPAYDQVAQRGYARYVFSPQERHLSYLRLTSFSSKPLWREIEATVSWQESDEGRERQKEASDLVVAERDRVTTLGLQFRLRSEPRSAWSLTTGVDLYSDLVRSTGEETDLATGTTVEKRGLYPDRAKAFDLAVYHAQSLDVRRFGLRAGVRCDFVSIRARDGLFGDTSISPAALAGHFSALYRVSGTLHAVFNLSRSFRAPNINDLSTFGLFDYGIEVPAPGLRPEYGTTVEAGAKSKGDRWAWALCVYRTRLQDLIVRVESTYLGSSYYRDERVYQKANAQRAYIQGVEAEAQGEIGRRFRTALNVTYTFGQSIDDDEPLRRIPPLNGRVRVDYYPNAAVEITAEWLFAAKQDRLSSGDIADHRIPPGGTPGWQVVNLAAQWRWGRVRWTAGLSNLFNEAYRTHGSGIDAPGRNVWTGVRWVW